MNVPVAVDHFDFFDALWTVVFFKLYFSRQIFLPGLNLILSISSWVRPILGVLWIFAEPKIIIIIIDIYSILSANIDEQMNLSDIFDFQIIP